MAEQSVAADTPPPEGSFQEEIEAEKWLRAHLLQLDNVLWKDLV